MAPELNQARLVRPKLWYATPGPRALSETELVGIDDHVFELEAGDAGGVEILIPDGDVEILQEDVADVGLLTITPTVKAHMPRSHQAHLEWTPSRLIHWAQTVGDATAQVIQAVLENKPHDLACAGPTRKGSGTGCAAYAESADENEHSAGQRTQRS